MSLTNRCSICDKPIDAYGRDGTTCGEHDMTTVTDAMIEAAHYATCKFAAPEAEPPYPFDLVDERRKAGMKVMLEAGLAASPTNKKPVAIDLEKAFFAQLCEAAGESNWIPQDLYFANDWIADCAHFLRTGEGVTPTNKEPSEADVERVKQKLFDQMENEEAQSLPSSMQGDKGLTWLEGWFDLRAAITAMQRDKP